MSPQLLRRIAVAAVGIPAAVAVVYAGGWALAGTLALLGAVGSGELCRLAARRGVRPLVAWGVVGGATLPFAVEALRHTGDARWVFVLGALWGMVALVVAMRRGPSAGPLAGVAVTTFAVLYAGGLPSFTLVLRHGGGWDAPAATALVFLPLVLTWVGDSLAMAGGALVGGRQLAPVLSPKKTWAGAVTGATAAVLVAPLYGAVVLERMDVHLATWQLVVVGLALAVAGQMGDVAESLLKREAGVKDSGGFFPGHGGVLDRLDALYWVMPCAVALFMLFGVV